MKYNIQVNQLILSETNLDIIDGAILDYLHTYCSSRNKKIDKQRIKDDDGDWTWVNYQTLLKDMPLLRIKSSGALTPRIKKIEEAGYIETYRKGNQKLFIRMNEKIDELFIKKDSSIHEDEQLSSKSCSPERTNYNTKVNNNTIDKREEITPKDEMILFIESEEYFNDMASMISTKLVVAEFVVKKELKRFLNYWMEKNGSGKKQRWEMQKTFELKRRLATWFINAQKFSQGSKPKIKEFLT